MCEDDIKVDLDTYNVPETNSKHPEIQENKLISVYCKSDHDEDLKYNLHHEIDAADEHVVVQEMSFDHEETTFGIIDIDNNVKRETDTELKTDDCYAPSSDENLEGLCY